MNLPAAFEKYLLLERLRSGRTAEVFIAKPVDVPGFDQLVALKRYPPRTQENRLASDEVLEDAQATGDLEHPNIVSVQDFGAIKRTPYVSMEYVRGVDLRALLARGEAASLPLSVPMAVFLASQVCAALEHAHQREVIHGRVSPAKVLLSFQGDVKLLGFGLPGRSAQDLRADPRLDVGAVGFLLDQLLARARPKGPRVLEWVVKQAMSADPSRRPPHCGVLQEDLFQFLVSDDTFYAAEDLGAFLRSAFAAELEQDRARPERYAAEAEPKRPAPRPRISKNAGSPLRPRRSRSDTDEAPAGDADVDVHQERTVVVNVASFVDPRRRFATAPDPPPPGPVPQRADEDEDEADELQASDFTFVKPFPTRLPRRESGGTEQAASSGAPRPPPLRRGRKKAAEAPEEDSPMLTAEDFTFVKRAPLLPEIPDEEPPREKGPAKPPESTRGRRKK